MARGCTLVRLVVSVLCGLVVDNELLADNFESIARALQALKEIVIIQDLRIKVLEVLLLGKETK